MKPSTKRVLTVWVMAAVLALLLYWWIPTMAWWVYPVAGLVVSGLGSAKILEMEAHEKIVDRDQR